MEERGDTLPERDAHEENEQSFAPGEIEEEMESEGNLQPWHDEELEALVEEYLWKWVAIRNREVVAWNESCDALISELKNMGLDLSQVELKHVTPDSLVEIV